MDDRTVIVAGGTRDPNLTCLIRAFKQREIPCLPLRACREEAPSLVWDLGSESLCIDGTSVVPRGVFLRHDVFGPLSEKTPAAYHQALAWYNAVLGFVLASPAVRLLNRAAASQMTSKIEVLGRAASVGLLVPRTRLTNQVEEARAFLEAEAKVAKPVAGGGLCFELEDALSKSAAVAGRTPSPALVQESLVPPELRVYRVGGRLFGFHVVSSVLDYRGGTDTRVVPAAVPQALGEGFFRLCEQMGLDFAAGDFKTSKESGELVFLEVNTCPMFAAFDAASKGDLAGAIAGWLAGEAPSA